MMRKYSLLVLIFVLNIAVPDFYAQNDSTLSNAIYATTYGVKNDKPILDNVKFIIKSEGKYTIEVEKFIDSEGVRFRDINNIWMVRYNGNYYYHLLGSGGTEKQFVLIYKDAIQNKFLRYFRVVEPQNNSNRILKSVLSVDPSSPISLGLSAISLSIVIPIKKIERKKYWLRKDERWGYIYFIDTQKSLHPRAKILSKRRLKKMYSNDKELTNRIDKNEVLFEEAVGLLEKLNN